jgi:predicted Fe-Mo cluster-binding NifX family protein
MLILLGSDGNNIESSISKRFGHAPYFLIYNTINKNIEAFENIDEGHNHDNLNNFLKNGVEAFIVGNIGPHAFDIINKPNIKIYHANKLTVKEAIEKFENSELKQLTEPTAKKSIGHSDHEHHNHEHHDRGHHNHGHHHNKSDIL